MKSNKKIIIPIVLIIAVAAAALFFYARYKQQNSAPAGAIRVSGNIEVTEVQLSFKIPGKVLKRLVNEGDRVTAGQTVAILDTSDIEREVAARRADLAGAESQLEELQAGARPEEIGQAAAMVRKAQAAVDEMEAGARPQEIDQAHANSQRASAARDEVMAGTRQQDIDSAEAAVAGAESEMKRREADKNRMQSLFDSGVTSKSALEAAQTGYDVAANTFKQASDRLNLAREGARKQQIEQAKAAASAAQEQYSLVKAGPRKEQIARAVADLDNAKKAFELVRKGPRKEKIDQAESRVQLAKESLALSETRLGYATLKSPVSGVALSKDAEEGEYVSPGSPVLTVGDITNVFLRAYINETDLGRVKVGQKVYVITDTYAGKKYEGTVTFIAPEAEFTPKNVQTTQERAKLVYRIKVAVPNVNEELKPGMPADAEIMTK